MIVTIKAPDLPESRVMDWNRRQWGIAAGWFGSAYGWMPLPTIDGAIRVMNGWYNRNPYPPEPASFMLDADGKIFEPRISSGWAHEMFRYAALTARVVPFKTAYL